MLPPLAAQELRRLGHEALSVLEVGLGAAEDAEVLDRAASDERIIVTKNFSDYARLLQERQSGNERCVPVVFVRRDDLPKRGALATHLAKRLHDWAIANSEPFIGLYWP